MHQTSAMFHGWISRFGVPAIITSDRGAQFTSSLWSAICSLLNIKHKTTTAFHPQSNGMVERFHRQLKNSLRARLASSDWFDHLPWVLLGLRSVPREDSATSASEAVYGSELTLPHQFLTVPDPPSKQFYDALKSSMSGFHPVPARHNTLPASDLQEHVPDLLSSCPMVFVRKDGHVPPLAPLYAGPYKVLSRSRRTFRLQVGNRAETVSVQRLKPAITAEEDTPELPPRRGRPPRAVRQAPPAPRPRGRPRKLVDSASSMSPPRRRKSVIFNLSPVIIWWNPSGFSTLDLRPLRWGGVVWKTMFRPPKQSSTTDEERGILISDRLDVYTGISLPEFH